MAHPSIRLVFHSIWSDTGTVWLRAPRLLLLALSIYVALDVLTFDEESDTFDVKAFRSVVDAIATVLLIPVDMALYRLLILDEQPSSYASYFRTVRFRRYLGWFAVFWLPANAAGLLPATAVVAGGLVGVAVVVIIAAIRLVLLFPALAAGAEDVTARDALRDTRGRFWIIVRTLLAAIVPFLLIGVLLFAAIWQLGPSGRTPPSFGPVALRAVMGGVFALVMNVVAIAVTARLFGWFGDRVKQGSTAA